MRGQRGFTLLEVLVALAFLAIVVGALLDGMSQYGRNAIHIKESTLAGWVARNQVVEYQLKVPWPAPSNKKGSETMAGHEWPWRVKISNTEDPAVRRIDVEVRKNKGDKNPLVSYVGYIGKK